MLEHGFALNLLEPFCEGNETFWQETRLREIELTKKGPSKLLNPMFI